MSEKDEVREFIKNELNLAKHSFAFDIDDAAPNWTSLIDGLKQVRDLQYRKLAAVIAKAEHCQKFGYRTLK